jgi:threonyl-tRNA synthetase
VLIEHTAGKWPLWINPRQAVVVPVHMESEKMVAYCEDVKAQLRAEGFYCDTNATHDQFKKKVRDAQLAQYSYILIVGDKETETRSVNIRLRDTSDQQELKTLDECIADMKAVRAAWQ